MTVKPMPPAPPGARDRIDRILYDIEHAAGPLGSGDRFGLRGDLARLAAAAYDEGYMHGYNDGARDQSADDAKRRAEAEKAAASEEARRG